MGDLHLDAGRLVQDMAQGFRGLGEGFHVGGSRGQGGRRSATRSRRPFRRHLHYFHSKDRRLDYAEDRPQRLWENAHTYTSRWNLLLDNGCTHYPGGGDSSSPRTRGSRPREVFHVARPRGQGGSRSARMIDVLSLTSSSASLRFDFKEAAARPRRPRRSASTTKIVREKNKNNTRRAGVYY